MVIRLLVDDHLVSSIRHTHLPYGQGTRPDDNRQNRREGDASAQSK